ncbi:hypothetical protein JOC78_001378 [Bacillus ectoiniformans]|uniref:hypothetical protein n=1 Tax=Bacillus ectoiniformans TaxID=1494429 RepID=UPI00195818A5|nr:hypothetical protein [Bacillus ectoiniformans]MBM7648436.1 hypothetical protein [Bacillus ectoiniformans]
MKKLSLGIIFLIFLLSGCSQAIPEEVDEYRLKQLIAATFHDKSLEANFKNITINEVANFLLEKEQKERFLYVLGGQYATKDELVSDPAFMRQLSLAWGEGDLKYHVQLPGDKQQLTTTFSATTMTAYNISYLVNIPAKIAANYQTNKLLLEYKGEEVLEDVVIKGSFYYFLGLDIFYAITGGILAFFMLFFGFFIGLLYSPIQSFLDVFPIFLDFVKTFYYSIKNF